MKIILSQEALRMVGLLSAIIIGQGLFGGCRDDRNALSSSLFKNVLKFSFQERITDHAKTKLHFQT